MKKYLLFILLFVILGTAQISFGLTTEQIGPNSSRGFPTFPQPSWPKGVYEITNLESRVYSIDTNGNTNYYFEATIEEINEIINLFSKVTMRDHIVRISGESGVRKTILIW